MVSAGLRIVFFGTPQFAVPTFEALLASRHAVVAAVTRADRPRGRGHKVTDAPIKARAVARDIAVLQPEKLSDPGFLDALRAGRRPTVFGVDYPTPDGSGVRDYIHVADLADAHVAATGLTDAPGHTVLNVGCGRGYSVLEVLVTNSVADVKRRYGQGSAA